MAQRRAALAGKRAVQLAARGREPSDAGHALAGSTMESALLAAQRLQTARGLADIAATLALAARESSALAHDRAAALHDQLARGAGPGLT